ncbi:MAG: hypothetical protein WD939_02015 [Dehalococcoidia bacterium]
MSIRFVIGLVIGLMLGAAIATTLASRSGASGHVSEEEAAG